MSPIIPSIGRSLSNHCRKRSKPYFTHQLLFDLGKFTEPVWCSGHNYQSYGSLLLQLASSEPVKMERLSYFDSAMEIGSCANSHSQPFHTRHCCQFVKLDRPGAKNAIGKDMLGGFQQTLEVIDKDSSANVVMICSSVPRVFCAGADLKALRIPTIAVVEGAALGGGLEMALSCDLRICGEDAVFNLPETGLAIIPGAGGIQRLPRLVGKSIAKELKFTGRKVDGRDATDLVNYCVPAGEAHQKALDVARDINQKGPLAIRMAKRAIDGRLEEEMSSALELEEECYEQLLNTKDRLEGLAAFAGKRKPRYIGK